MIEFEHTPLIKDWLGTGSINYIGLPYSGKDSQGDRTVERFDAVKFGGGQILRELQLNPEIQAIMDRGELIPSEAYVQNVLPLIGQSPEDKPLVLSAVGRFDGEQQGVMQLLEATGHPLKAVINLELDNETVRERFATHEEFKLRDIAQADRGDRRDDDVEAFETRLTEFESKTLPVIAWYRERDLVIDIDATQTKDAVELAVLNGLAARALRNA